MTKTFDDYMNDPDIINEPMGLRITHAMRFKVRDETKNMTFEEREAYSNEAMKRAFASIGMTPKYTSPYAENT